MCDVKNESCRESTTMTLEMFNELANRIQSGDKLVSKKFDYSRWVDDEGNWYSKSNHGYSQTLFYAGVRYFLKYKYVPGVPSECSTQVWEWV